MSLSAAYVSALFSYQGSAFGGSGSIPLGRQSTMPTETVQQAEAGRAKGIAAEARDPAVSQDVAAFRRAVV